MIIYKQFEASYIDEVVNLLKPLWGHLSIPERKAYFRWKYFDNKLNNQITAFIAIDDKKNKVVGFRGYFNTPFRMESSNYNIGVYSDAVVQKEYAGQGIFHDLNKKYWKNKSFNFDFFMAASSNEKSSNVYKKLGAEVIEYNHILYKISLFNGLNKNKTLRIEKSYSFNYSIFDKIYKLNSKRACINNNREFWEWRYSNPITKYIFLYLYEEGNPIGFMSLYKINKYRAFILDYHLKENRLIKDCVNYLRRNDGIYLCQMWSITKRKKERKLLKNTGFKMYRKLIYFIKKQEPQAILIRPESFTITDDSWFINNKDIREEKAWRLNLICSDGI